LTLTLLEALHYEDVEFRVPALDGDQLLASRLGHLTPGERAHNSYGRGRRLEPEAGLDAMAKRRGPWPVSLSRLMKRNLSSKLGFRNDHCSLMPTYQDNLLLFVF